jgi:hypothetical protein
VVTSNRPEVLNAHREQTRRQREPIRREIGGSRHCRPTTRKVETTKPPIGPEEHTQLRANRLVAHSFPMRLS